MGILVSKLTPMVWKHHPQSIQCGGIQDTNRFDDCCVDQPSKGDGTLRRISKEFWTSH